MAPDGNIIERNALAQASGKDHRGVEAIQPRISRSDSPTEMERTLSYVISLFAPLAGFFLGAWLLTYPMRGFKILGRNCILIAILPTTVALLLEYVVFR